MELQRDRDELDGKVREMQALVGDTDTDELDVEAAGLTTSGASATAVQPSVRADLSESIRRLQVLDRAVDQQSRLAEDERRAAAATITSAWIAESMAAAEAGARN